MSDDRLDRMMADPVGYIAEARERARELVERDARRERERARVERRVRLLARLRWWSRR